MALVLKLLQVTAIVLLAVLLAAAFDVGHIGLMEMVAPFAIAPIALIAIFLILPLFLSPKKAGNPELDMDGVGEKLGEMQAKLNSRVAALQTKVDALNGQDKESLEEENRALKEQLEAIHQAEREKVENDAQDLRKRNEELENQIKQWAIKSVGGSISEVKEDEEAA